MKSLIAAGNSYLAAGILSSLPVSLQKNARLISDISALKTGIQEYDFIFSELKHFQQGLCFPSLKNRKRNSQLFFFQASRRELETARLLGCCENARLLPKILRPEELNLAVEEALTKMTVHDVATQVSPCETCAYPYLTASQLRILIGIKYGHSIREIANVMNISTKTVCAQLDRVKANFNLRSRQDLYIFFSHNLQCNGPVIRGDSIRTLRMNIG